MPMITLGPVEIERVEEMIAPFPAAGFVPDPAILAKHAHWLAPQFYNPSDESFPLSFHSWLLRVDGRTIVVDPCSGNDRVRPVFPVFDHLDIPFLERFCATGTRPEEVDYVFCTHLHNDHCGWNTQLRNGHFIPTFPKARYLFVRRELERWDPGRPGHQPVDFNLGVYEDSILPVLEAGLVDLVGPDHRLSPSLSIMPAYGHTLGHTMLHLETPDARAYFVGDALHHPIEVAEPEEGLAGADDPALTVETRRRIYARCADERALLFPAHFPAPHAGWIARDGAGFRFTPWSS